MISCRLVQVRQNLTKIDKMGKSGNENDNLRMATMSVRIELRKLSFFQLSCVVFEAQWSIERPIVNT